MLKSLIKFSNHLDEIGLEKEADYLDGLIYKMADENPFDWRENRQEGERKRGQDDLKQHDHQFSATGTSDYTSYPLIGIMIPSGSNLTEAFNLNNILHPETDKRDFINYIVDMHNMFVSMASEAMFKLEAMDIHPRIQSPDAVNAGKYIIITRDIWLSMLRQSRTTGSPGGELALRVVNERFKQIELYAEGMQEDWAREARLAIHETPIEPLGEPQTEAVPPPGDEEFYEKYNPESDREQQVAQEERPEEERSAEEQYDIPSSISNIFMRDRD